MENGTAKTQDANPAPSLVISPPQTKQQQPNEVIVGKKAYKGPALSTKQSISALSPSTYVLAANSWMASRFSVAWRRCWASVAIQTIHCAAGPFSRHRALLTFKDIDGKALFDYHNAEVKQIRNFIGFVLPAILAILCPCALRKLEAVV